MHTIEIKPDTLKETNAITFDEKSFIVNGQREIFIGGEFHYFRTPAELWEDRLIKMKRAGANLISTYIPWNWHEQIEGVQLWHGDRDVRRFLELCKKHGLYVILKPGPYCCAELDFGGHPDWLLSKNVLLRRLDERYLFYVENWYKKVAEIISPFLITNGGPVFCVQVENEYDHLLWYGDDKICIRDAITYFKKLSQMMFDFGIDVPKFANEAEFLRGNGIIDTRTYYPNIPTFTDWMWEFEHYDEKITAAKKQQPNCPTMIMELQKGWFGAHGHPNYYPELNHTQSVSKSVLIQGASVMNFYMFTGGTTFPFWGCRADEWAADRWGTVCRFNPVGCGVTTSFDFGGSFIREWGELLDGGYKWIKAFNLFVHDFKDLIANSENTDDIQAISIDKKMNIVHSKLVDGKIYSRDLEKFCIITKKLNGQYLTCIRNISPDDRIVKIVWKNSRRAIFNRLRVKSHETLLLPVNVHVPGTDIIILASTSELLFARKLNGRTVFGIYGKAGRSGRTILNQKMSACQSLAGKIKIQQNAAQTILSYKHDGIQIVKINEHILFICDEEWAGSIDFLQDGLFASDAYFIREIGQNTQGAHIEAELKPGSKNTFSYFSFEQLRNVTKNGSNIPIQYNETLGRNTFSYYQPKVPCASFDWIGNWKIKPDTDEICSDFDDHDWFETDGPSTLEALNFVEHGYVWFRTQFKLPDTFQNACLTFTGNNIDRQFIYVNGFLVRRGRIDQAEIDIQNAARPGQNQIAILYQNFFHTKSHPHEGPIIKYSGVMNPLRIHWIASGTCFFESIIRFKIRQQLNGMLKGFTRQDYDDSCWQEVIPSQKYIMHDDVGAILWLRRRFKYNKIANSDVAVNFHIPGAEFRCFIYVNGKAAGWYESIGPQKDFYIPENFLKEENILAIILEGPRGFLIEPEFRTFYETVKVKIRFEQEHYNETFENNLIWEY